MLRIEYILWRILMTKSMFDVAKYAKKVTVKDVPINYYELLSIQACSFEMFWGQGAYPISSGKLQALNSSSKIH